MSENVIQLLSRKKKVEDSKLDDTKEETPHLDLEALAEKNKQNKERLKNERAKENKMVLKLYQIKQ